MAVRGRPRSFDREEALRRAMELFWQRGYESTSIADLTAAMGIHSPSLYAAFGSKEELFREAVELYDAREGETTRRAFAEPTARAAVEAMLRGNADAFADPATPTGCMVVLGSTAVPDESGDVGSFLSQRRRQDLDGLRRRLDEAVRDGDLAPETDTAAVAAFYTTVLQGLALQARDGASREQLQRIIDCAMGAWPAICSGASQRPTPRP